MRRTGLLWEGFGEAEHPSSRVVLLEADVPLSVAIRSSLFLADEQLKVNCLFPSSPG